MLDKLISVFVLFCGFVVLFSVTIIVAYLAYSLVTGQMQMVCP